MHWTMSALSVNPEMTAEAWRSAHPDITLKYPPGLMRSCKDGFLNEREPDLQMGAGTRPIVGLSSRVSFRLLTSGKVRIL
jgi:hypothetical protein